MRDRPTQIYQGNSPKRKDLCPRALASDLFSSLQCKDLLPNQVSITISSKAKVHEACAVLLKNNLAFAPVESSEEGNSIMGLFTFRSLCRYLVKNYAKQATRKLKRSSSMLNMSEFDLRQLVCAFAGPDRPANEYATVDAFVQCAGTEPVSLPAKRFSGDFEFVKVISGKGEFVGVLTQEVLLKRFVESCPQLDAVFSQSVIELFPSCSQRQFPCISEKETVLSALNIISDTNERAIAVTSESGCLIGSISLEDIKELFRARQQKLLFSEVRHFTVYVRSQSMTEYGLAAVRECSKVSHAIQKMVNTKLLQLWVVDSQNKPTGLLKAEDVFSYLCSE